MNSAWALGYASVQDWIDRNEPKGNTFSEATKTKKLNLRWGNKDAARFHQLKAFASAVITNDQLNQALKESLTQALAQGKSLRDWRKEADKVFDAQGITPIGNWQATTIFRTETGMAYGAGQYAKLQDVSERYPYWQYSTAGDERVRDEHRILDGKIFEASNAEYWPPLGFNCRCRAIPVSRLQAQKRGITGPDTITPQMKGQLQNAEFIGSKTGNYLDWLETKMGTITRQARDYIITKAEQLGKQATQPETTQQ